MHVHVCTCTLLRAAVPKNSRCMSVTLTTLHYNKYAPQTTAYGVIRALFPFLSPYGLTRHGLLRPSLLRPSCVPRPRKASSIPPRPRYQVWYCWYKACTSLCTFLSFSVTSHHGSRCTREGAFTEYAVALLQAWMKKSRESASIRAALMR